MRIRYVPISEKEWTNHYQHGRGFIGTSYQRGAGLGSIFRTLFRAILPIAKTAGRVVGKRALKAGAEIASDLVSGKNFKESLTRHGRDAGADLLQDASAQLKGKQAGGKLGKRSIKGKKKPVITKNRVTQIGTIRA